MAAQSHFVDLPGAVRYVWLRCFEPFVRGLIETGGQCAALDLVLALFYLATTNTLHISRYRLAITL
jgi:hypothetical protein